MVSHLKHKQVISSVNRLLCVVFLLFTAAYYLLVKAYEQRSPSLIGSTCLATLAHRARLVDLFFKIQPLKEKDETMDREKYQKMMRGAGKLDYEIYLNTEALLACQKNPEDLCNPDELQFMIVHQIEELWMKLMATTLLDIDDEMKTKNTFKVLTLFRRVHMCQEMMTTQLSLLETMSPKDYQEIRLLLGNGSGQESPGFRVLLAMPKDLWSTFETHYLDNNTRRLEDVYDTGYAHDAAYMVAEALAEFDEQFQKFRNAHMQLIYRSIGVAANSLKGRPVEILNEGLRHKFFPPLWQVRAEMTDSWGGTYGKKRETLSQDTADEA